MAACTGNDHEDLRGWMAENTKDLRGSIPKLPEAKPYQPISYESDGAIDPFKPGRIEPDSKDKGAQKGSPFLPDFEARELRNSLLEKYPLESLKMIGYLNIGNRPFAVIRVDHHVKQVKVGEYLGQNFGLVTQITDQEVTLRELVQDSAGDWGERTSSLYLQRKEGDK